MCTFSSSHTHTHHRQTRVSLRLSPKLPADDRLRSCLWHVYTTRMSGTRECRGFAALAAWRRLGHLAAAVAGFGCWQCDPIGLLHVAGHGKRGKRQVYDAVQLMRRRRYCSGNSCIRFTILSLIFADEHAVSPTPASYKTFNFSMSVQLHYFPIKARNALSLVIAAAGSHPLSLPCCNQRYPAHPTMPPRQHLLLQRAPAHALSPRRN